MYSLVPILLLFVLQSSAQNTPNATNPPGNDNPFDEFGVVPLCLSRVPAFTFSDFAFVKQGSSGSVPEPLAAPALGFSRDGQHLFVIGGKDEAGVTLQSFYTYDFNSTTWEIVSFPQVVSHQ